MLKEKKVFTVNVPEEEIREVEKAWYEYNAAQSNVRFLAEDKLIDWEVLNEFNKAQAETFIKCEKLKAAVANKYKPEEVDLSKYDYAFDFNECTLTFTEA